MKKTKTKNLNKDNTVDPPYALWRKRKDTGSYLKIYAIVSQEKLFTFTKSKLENLFQNDKRLPLIPDIISFNLINFVFIF